MRRLALLALLAVLSGTPAYAPGYEAPPAPKVIVEMYASAYAPLDPAAVAGGCHNGDPTRTATGTYPEVGTVAVNPKVIPYGTKLYIEGYGWGVAEDTGGAIRARTDLIDLFFLTRDEAIKWGVRKVVVHIYK